MNVLRHLFNLSVFIVISLAFASCDGDDDTYVFSGTVRYSENQNPAAGVTVELQLFDEVPSISIDRTSNIVSFTTQTHDDGHYSFNISSDDIPDNPHFFILTKTETLMNVSMVRPGFPEDGCLDFQDIPMPLQSFSVSRDLLVDYPTYLQITFDKVNNESTDSIRYVKECFWSIETSPTQPDTTILEKESL